MRSFNLLRFLVILGVCVIVLGAAAFGVWHWAWYYATNSARFDELAEVNTKPLLNFAASSPTQGTPQGPAPAASPSENPFSSPQAPIASYAEYRRCGGAAQTVRAHGDLIGCSISRITDRLRILIGEGETFYRQMRAACYHHDFCYAQGGATYGLNRAACDKGFLADIVRECSLIYSDPTEDLGGDTSGDVATDKPARRARAEQLASAHANCRRQAVLAYEAVRWRGGDDYSKNYQPVCDYEPGPHAARDTVVVGRFLDAPDAPAARDYGLTVSLSRDKGEITLRLMELNAQGQSEDRGQWSVKPEAVPVVDRDRTCRVLTDAAGSAPALRCPQTLKDTAITAADWVRFQPIVIDADGVDGAEILLPTLTRDFGLGFTHIRFSRTANDIQPDIRGYLSVGRFSDEPGTPGCEHNLEFSDCDTVSKANGRELPILSDERSVQSLSHDFLVVNRRQAGCGEPAFLGQDLVLNSRHALRDTAASGNMGFRFRRFTYDKASDRWVMHRDRHQNDGHRVYRCGGAASPYEHYKRFQYPQFNAGFDVECDDASSCPSKCTDPARGNDRLEIIGAVMREKCPTSTFRPGAGELNDIDLMLYDMNTRAPAPNVSGPEDPRDNALDWINSTWSPLIWKEPAHPLVSSPKARQGPDRIMAVGTYVGGDGQQKALEEIRTGLSYADKPANARERLDATLRRTQQKYYRWRDRRYPVLSVLRHMTLFHKTLLGTTVGGRGVGEVRIPDTHGHLPDRYAVSWDIKAYGNPASYYELPSVLVALGRGTQVATRAVATEPAEAQIASTGPQVAMTFFLNPYLSANLRTERQRGPDEEAEASEWESGDYQLRDGSFRALIVPVPQQGDTPVDVARMVDCPIDGVVGGGSPAPTREGWQKHFLKNEPVLVGHFYAGTEPNDGKQSMAVAWRREDGTIQLTALRFDGRDWRFGDKLCQDPQPLNGAEGRGRPKLKLRKLP